MKKIEMTSEKIVKLNSQVLENETIKKEYQLTLASIENNEITKKTLSSFSNVGYGQLEKLLYSTLEPSIRQFIPDDELIKRLVYIFEIGEKIQPLNLKYDKIEKTETAPSFIPENNVIYKLTKDKKLSHVLYTATLLSFFNQVLLTPVNEDRTLDKDNVCRLMTFDSMANLRPEAITIEDDKEAKNS